MTNYISLARALSKAALLPVIAITIAILSGCDRGGQSVYLPPSNGASAPPAGPSKIFVADSDNRVIASFANADPPAGEVGVDRLISGSAVGNFMEALVYDAIADRLYVADDGSFPGVARSITIIDDASIANGPSTASRQIRSTALNRSITTMSLDAANDLLYVNNSDASSGNAVVLVFSGISTASNDVVPDQVNALIDYSGTPVSNVGAMHVDTINDILYVSTSVSRGLAGFADVILAYPKSSLLSTAAPAIPNREMGIGIAGGGRRWIVCDTVNDRLFVSSGSKVLVFDFLSFLPSGITTPARAIELTYAIAGLALAPLGDRLYSIVSDPFIQGHL